MRPAIAVSSGLPAALEAYRAVLKRSGRNLAATAADPAAASRVFYAGLCAAIRAGWCEGYSAGIRLVAGAGRDIIRDAAGFTRFSTDTSCFFRGAGDNAAPEDRAWILDQFVRRFEIGGAVYEFTPRDALCLASKFGAALKINEQIHECIRQARNSQPPTLAAN